MVRRKKRSTGAKARPARGGRVPAVKAPSSMMLKLFGWLIGIGLSAVLGALVVEYPPIKIRIRNAWPQLALEDSGRLIPGSSPSPRDWCEQFSGKSAVILSAGNNTVVPYKNGKSTVVNVDGNTLLEIELNENGYLDVHATVYNKDKKKLLTLIGGLEWKKEIPQVRVFRTDSSIQVLDVDGDQLLKVEFLNAHAAIVEGVFYATDLSKTLRVAQNWIDYRGANIANNCFATGLFVCKEGLAVTGKGCPKPRSLPDRTAPTRPAAGEVTQGPRLSTATGEKG